MKNNIRIYRVKSEYIKYLSMYQKHIFAQGEGKDNRKYIGVVFEMGGMKFFAHLTFYKDKHKKMKESIDIIKIKDYAIINLNNMIPVPDSQVIDFETTFQANK